MKKKKKKKKQSGGAVKKDKLSYDGIYLCKGGGNEMTTQDHYDNLFKGWGFTFL